MPATKNLAIIGALCVLGLVLYALTGDPDYTAPEALPDPVVQMTSIDPGTVESITFSRGEERFVLVRDGELWRHRDQFDYPADAEKITRLFEGLTSLEAPMRRGASAAGHADFEVDAAQGFRVELAGTGTGLPISVTVGKAEAIDRSFVRFGDEETVYSVEPNLRYTAGLGGRLDPLGWLDKVVARAPSDEAEITGFRFETENGVIEARKFEVEVPAAREGGEPTIETTWKVVSPEVFEADAAIIRGLESAVRAITAVAAADPAGVSDYGLDPPRRTLTITREDADPIVVETGGTGAVDESTEGVYARRKGDDRILLLAPYTADHLFKSLDQLRPAPPDDSGTRETGPPPAPPPTGPPSGGEVDPDGG